MVRFIKLRTRMMECDMKPDELAQKMQLSVSALYDRLSGKQPFDTWQIARIAKILNIENGDEYTYFPIEDLGGMKKQSGRERVRA